MKEYIGIDLGSNSLRCVRMNKDFEVLGEYEETIRTAEGLEENKVIGFVKLCASATWLPKHEMDKDNNRYANMDWVGEAHEPSTLNKEL